MQNSKSGTEGFRFHALESSTFKRILRVTGLSKLKTLDIGCGFGEHLKHFGAGSVGITTTVIEVEHGKREGLQILRGNAELINQAHDVGRFDAVWANNLFEHLLSPHGFLIKLKTVSNAHTVLVLGVPVVPKIASLMRLRKFRGALAGAHVNFFTRETLRLTVERAGWTIREIRPFYIGIRLIDEFVLGHFMPHLYVVCENDLNFKYNDKKLREWKDDAHYQDLIKIANGQLATRT